MNLTTQQLAEILVGIARAQQAIIDAVDASRPGFKGTYLSSVLDSAAKIRSTGRPMTLQDYPARVLLQCQGRAGPNVEQITRDLEALLSELQPVPPAFTAVPAAARPAARASAQPAAASGASDNDLDMTR